MTTCNNLPITHLVPHKFARKVDPDAVRDLAESIRIVGLINPIRVRPRPVCTGWKVEDGWEIVAGRHRVEAMKQLGIKTIDAIVVDDNDLLSELALIDENLIRKDLGNSERALTLARRKELHEELNPTTRHGSHNRDDNQSRRSGDFDNLRFTKEVSDKTGRSERLVQKDITRAKRIAHDVLKKISDTKLDRPEYLDHLKDLSHEEQRAKVSADIARPDQPPKQSKKNKEITSNHKDKPSDKKPIGDAILDSVIDELKGMSIEQLLKVIAAADRLIDQLGGVRAV